MTELRSNAAGLRRHQFSLRDLLVAVTFIAMACGAVRFLIVSAGWSSNPMPQLLSAGSVPILLSGAVGAMRGKVRFWLSYGVAIDIVILGAVIIDQLASKR
jgi:hypothetical protein